MKKLSFILILIGLVACSDKDPMPLSPDDPVGQVLTQEYSRADFSKVSDPVETNMYSSSSLLLGDLDSKSCGIFLRFSSIPDSVVIVSAELELNPNALVAVNEQDFEAVVFKMTDTLSVIEVTNEEFLNSGFIGDEVTRSTVTTAESDSVLFSLDPDWVISEGFTKNGMYIRAATPGLARSFAARGATGGPTLTLIYHEVDSTANDTTVYSVAEDTYIFENKTTITAGPLYVANGAEQRSTLKFNLAEIPDEATINKAILTLTIDHENSYFFQDSTFISMNAHLMGDDSNELFPDSLEYSIISSDVNIYPYNAIDSVEIDIRPAVQVWTRNDDEYGNYGLMLFPVSPTADVQRVAFYNNNAPDGKAPKLHIYYTLPPTIGIE